MLAMSAIQFFKHFVASIRQLLLDDWKDIISLKTISEQRFYMSQMFWLHINIDHRNSFILYLCCILVSERL